MWLAESGSGSGSGSAAHSGAKVRAESPSTLGEVSPTSARSAYLPASQNRDLIRIIPCLPLHFSRSFKLASYKMPILFHIMAVPESLAVIRTIKVRNSESFTGTVQVLSKQ